MRIKVISPDRLLEVTVDGESLKEVWGPLSSIQEVLSYARCGNCESVNVRFDMRTPKGYIFRSLSCNECGARLEFGETKEGERLFAKRKDRDGNQMANNGWEIWKPDGQSAPEPVAPTADKDIPF